MNLPCSRCGCPGAGVVFFRMDCLNPGCRFYAAAHVERVKARADFYSVAREVVKWLGEPKPDSLLTLRALFDVFTGKP